MTPDDVIILAGRLAADGEPYVLATVVRVRRPASTRPGDRALVRAAGTIAGWVGGACAEPVVIRESLRALAAGEPRLVRIGPEGDDDPDGADVVVATTCASDGTVEVLLEPCVAGPLLAVVGEMVVVDGVTYHFCCSGCRARFEIGRASGRERV